MKAALKLFMKAFIFLLLTSACMSSSCSKSVSNNAANLIGTWMLEQKSGGFAGQTTVPDKITTLTFQNNNKYSKNYNNQPIENGVYVLTTAGKANYYYSDTLLKLISVKHVDTLVYGLHIAHDSLLLNEGCCDRFSYIYTRQQ